MGLRFETVVKNIRINHWEPDISMPNIGNKRDTDKKRLKIETFEILRNRIRLCENSVSHVCIGAPADCECYEYNFSDLYCKKKRINSEVH